MGVRRVLRQGRRSSNAQDRGVRKGIWRHYTRPGSAPWVKDMPDGRWEGSDIGQSRRASLESDQVTASIQGNQQHRLRGELSRVSGCLVG